MIGRLSIPISLRRAIRHGALGLALGLGVAVCGAADWPRWRGPNFDGLSPETNWFKPWPKEGPPILWRASVGIGFATVSVSEGLLYTIGNSNDVDTVFCLDAATGRSVWAKNLTNERDLKLPEWSLAGSPLVEGDLLILNAGSAGTAVDKHTGRIVWSSGPGPGGYATPVPFEHQGRRAIAIFGAKDLVAVDPRTGREWWRHPWESGRDVNAADPIFSDGKLFISSSSGCALLQLRDGAPAVVWAHTNLMRNLS